MRGLVRNLKLRGPQLVVATAAGYALMVGALTLLGYGLGVRRLTDWNDVGISMFPNAAVCAGLSGVALLLAIADDRKSWHIAVRVIACVVGSVGGLTLLEHLSGANIGIDTLLSERNWGQHAATAPLRMGPPASSSYIIIGTGLLLVTYGTRARRYASALGVIIVAIASLSLVGYWFGANQLFGVARFTGIAFQTSSALAAIGMGLIALVPESGLARILRRDDAGGVIVRRLISPIIAIPLTLGWLRVLGQEAGYFDTAFGSALIALMTITMLVALLWWTANGVSRQAQLARIAEDSVREREQALRASEARLRSIINQLPAGVGVMDSTGQWILTNSTMDLFIPEAIPSTLPDRVHHWHAWDEQGNPIAPENWPGKRALRGETVVPGPDMLYTDQGGRDRWMRVSAAPLCDETDALIGATCVVQDVTLLKKAERELLEANRHKDDFLATLSHELRTPLTAVLGWSRLIQKNPADAKTVQEGIEIITRSARLQADLINDLLDMTRIISGKIRLQVEDVELSQIVQVAVDSTRHAAEAKQIHLETELNPIAAPVQGDAVRLQQILWNLLSNALKFTPSGGRVHVALRERDGHAELSVSDNGQGIASTFLPFIFERFRQADSSTARVHGGLGIGLAIVKQLVELHGGRVSAESPGAGQGSTFRIVLPLAGKTFVDAPRGCSRISVRATSVALDLKGIRILTVDDDADTRTLIKRILEDAQAEVLSAESADEALRCLQRQTFDVLLSDLGMPERDGYEFLRAMRASGHSLPAIAVTAFARSEDHDRALDAGYRAHISKPIEPTELLETLATILKRTNGER